jgi:hypothetical protein
VQDQAPDGPGDVLLEDAALEQLQQGHADDGGRVGRGDGHAGLEAEVGVGGAEDHRQRQTDGDGEDHAEHREGQGGGKPFHYLVHHRGVALDGPAEITLEGVGEKDAVLDI